MPEGHTVTRERARKNAIRARMAASGEPYSVAARKLAAPESASDAVLVREIIARANTTLAAPSARIEFRTDMDIVERRRPGLIGRMVRSAARAAWERLAPDMDAADLLHHRGEGFLEPAAGRYQVDFGGYAVMFFEGKEFGGKSGHPLQARNLHPRALEKPDHPLRLLGLLQGVTSARHVGDETLRGTPCRTTVVRSGPAELTVWIDDKNIRQIQTEERGSDEDASVTMRRPSVTIRRTVELWDFGVSVDKLDWSRLPSLRSPG